ncbi:hypothetical protein F3Y22_tig00111715pilonHSYRG00049 [Hibiscus syriacus]|uniref:Uncharacterized protein n=1 Tax=Hibiscus syriacus TaxID=106335 RepID=A0A6A2YGV1_HIBSY|nr:hypothetical protein F3Y22_tig00111715pilonHSYRG00049 [Hibiscus syriacus]
MIRYSSMEEVNAALVELEEHEHIASTDKTSNEKHSDTEKPFSRTTSYSVSADIPSILNGSEENGGMHEEIGDGDNISESGSETIEQEGHNEDDLDEENHDDGCDTDEDDGGPGSDEDDEVHVSMDHRKLELRGRPTLNMMIPMNVFDGSSKYNHRRVVGGESGDEVLDEEAGGSQEVQDPAAGVEDHDIAIMAILEVGLITAEKSEIHGRISKIWMSGYHICIMPTLEND